MPVTPDPALARTSSDRPLTIIALDYGRRRIGVAVGQQVTDSASPLGTLSNTDGGPNWHVLDDWIAEWRPAVLVVGMPWAEDGSPSSMTAEVDRFVEALQRYDLPVNTADERYSSLEATEALRQARAEGRRRRVRKEAIDATAAVLIAERWLRQAARDT